MLGNTQDMLLPNLLRLPLKRTVGGIGYWAESSPLPLIPRGGFEFPNTHYLKDCSQLTGGIRSFA